jgi:hypothetical protein
VIIDCEKKMVEESGFVVNNWVRSSQIDETYNLEWNKQQEFLASISAYVSSRNKSRS